MDLATTQSLDAFGSARVLVVMEDTAMAAAAADASVSEAITDRFFTPDAATAANAPGGNETARPEVHEYFPNLGIALGYVDEGNGASLDADDAVEDIFLVPYLELIEPTESVAASEPRNVTWGIERIGIPTLWDAGLTGSGVAVGHLDTGVDGTHPALNGRITEFREFDMAGQPVNGSSPNDSGVHGTHTAGTICGSSGPGRSIGVAPNAELYAGLVIEGGDVMVRVLRGLDWLVGQTPIRVLSLSLGFRGQTPFFQTVFQRIRNQQILPVVAIGNEGPATSRAPGNYETALSVGAIDKSDAVAQFSGSDSFGEGFNKPDVLAPGSEVVSCAPGGGFTSKQGTSMATPHVAGLAALLIERNSQISVDALQEAIVTTADQLPGHDPLRHGNGLINGPAALQAVDAL